MVTMLATLVTAEEAQQVRAFGEMLESATFDQLAGWFRLHELLAERFHDQTPLGVLRKIFEQRPPDGSPLLR